MDGIEFLGGPIKPQQNNLSNVNPINPAPKVAEPIQPIPNPIVPANPLNYSAPQQFAPIYNNYAYNNRVPYNNPQGYGYNTPNNGFSAYNQPNYQNAYQMNSTNGSYGNPYNYQGQQTAPYYQPPVTGGMYSNSIPNYNSPLVQSPYAPVNPYANIPENIMSQITAVSQSPIK